MLSGSGVGEKRRSAALAPRALPRQSVRSASAQPLGALTFESSTGAHVGAGSGGSSDGAARGCGGDAASAMSAAAAGGAARGAPMVGGPMVGGGGGWTLNSSCTL
tara:strand:+ start:395 stop:709 length:315 start_codon:yes stop_codon:yes gene_type:complete